MHTRYFTAGWGHKGVLAGLLLPVFLMWSGCERGGERSVTLLAVNDVYRIEGIDGGASGGLARLRSLRLELERDAPDLLLLHAGDFLFPSLLSRRYDGAHMVDAMNWLDGDGPAFDDRLLVTFGNHEFDKSGLEHAALLNDRLHESRFRWLGSNIRFRNNKDGRPLVHGENLVPSLLLESGGLKVGLFSITTRFKDAEYIESFDDYTTTARKMSGLLRARGADVVIAVTHLLLSEDKALLQSLGPAGPDLIVGGHEHLRQFAEVDGRWVLKADADLFTATVVRLVVAADGSISTSYEYRRLDEGIAKDAVVQQKVDQWLARYDREFCGSLQEPDRCLDAEVGRTRTELVAEELAIRQFETGFGNWTADLALAAFRDQGAQLAFINSGSLRLNQNIAANSPVTRRHVEETFAYPAHLKLLRIDGATLGKVAQRAVQDWTANGWWLQIAGFAYRHDPETNRATDLTLLAADGARPIRDEETLLVVTNDYLAGGNDGYTMLGPAQLAVDPDPPVDLKQLVVQALQQAGATGIAPGVQGRICNPLRPGPCLAVPRQDP